MKSSFRKWSDGKYSPTFNKAVFDIMVYYFSVDEVAAKSLEYKSEIMRAFCTLCEEDKDFLLSFEHTTKSKDNTEKRFVTWGKKLEEVLGIEINIPAFK